MKALSVICALILLAGLGCAKQPTATSANSLTPAQMREAIVSRFDTAFAQYPLGDYVYGALMFRPDARVQFESIMEFPPFLNVIERGKRMWETPFKNGKRYADCFPNSGRNVAGNYPKYDIARDRVVTFEMAVNDCLVANGEMPLEIGDMSAMGVLMAYARTLSDGALLDVRVDNSGARTKFDAGRQEYFRRRGSMNLACANCHIDLAGRRMRDEIISPVVGQATHWPVFRRGGEELLTVQGYFRRCMTQVRAQPFPIGSEAMNNLEYFHAYLSNTLPLRASVYRK